MSRLSASFALVALPLAATLHAQELSEAQRAEIAARIAPVGKVCLQGENCGGMPARSVTPPRASGTMSKSVSETMASAPAKEPAKAAGGAQADNASEQEMNAAPAPAADTAEAVSADTDTAEAVNAATAGFTTAAIDGEAIYNQACVACHASGVGGAPVVGDVDSWSPRIAKGIEALHNSGINGIAGSAMMAKGGRVDLSDQQVMAAVDYMVGASQ